MSVLFSLLPAVILAIFGGLLATWLHLANRPNSYIEKWALKISWFSLFIYFTWLLLLTVHQKQFPFISAGQLAAFIGLLIWGAHLYAQRMMKQGILVVLPIITVIILILISLVLGAQPADVPDMFKGYWVSFHITFEMAGVALLLGAGVFGFGYLILHRQIKKRKFGPFFSMMPSLSDLNQLRSLTITSGWIFVTAGTLGGTIWILMREELYQALSGYLGIAIIFWGIVTLMTAASRFRWFRQHQLAGFSALISAVMIILIMMSIIITYPGSLK
ncbi:MAG: cytochrome c biogenesis protein CcsA [Candidatus Zixiibacteriota bacterium]|nr:MAG: cytochrome c biogenesis protein CcsA [candidate division Zixibacteria bacterium]